MNTDYWFNNQKYLCFVFLNVLKEGVVTWISNRNQLHLILGLISDAISFSWEFQVKFISIVFSEGIG